MGVGLHQHWWTNSWDSFHLRIPDIHRAKFQWNLLTLNISKIWRILFWAMFHRWQKWSKSSKAPPGGRVEIEDVTCCIFNIFNFSSTTRWRFFHFDFFHLWTLGQKSIIQIFDTLWLDKNIRQNVKHQCFRASVYQVPLNVDSNVATKCFLLY